MRSSTFVTTVTLIVLLALVVRIVYVTTAIVDVPIRGDANQYVLHAWNLVHRGTYSTELPDGGSAVGDDHRGPGYALFLASAMVLAGHSELPLREGPQDTVILGYATDTWMRYVYGVQIVLGSLTVLLTIGISRFWLGRAASLAVGAMAALWPHLVVSSGVLLSEDLLAFVCAVAVYATLRMLLVRSVVSAAAAGVGFGLVFLVNPVIAPFPVFVAAVAFFAANARIVGAFLVAFAVLPAGWTAVNSHATESLRSRALAPFVVGSWPQFYAAYNSRFNDEISAKIMEAYAEEEQTFERDPREGFNMMRERMSLDPFYYAQWYLLQKPFLLWDWDIRIGPGSFYTMQTRQSPYERNPLLRSCAAILKAMNPMLFFAALFATAGVLVQFFARWRDKSRYPTAVVAGLFLYVTIVYSILQSEPRYSVAFRPIEFVLALTMLEWLWRIAAARLFRNNISA